MYDISDCDFKKDDVIDTPLQLAKFIYNKVKRKAFKNVLDVGSSSGNLTYYFKNKIGLDIEDLKVKNFSKFVKELIKEKRTK